MRFPSHCLSCFQARRVIGRALAMKPAFSTLCVELPSQTPTESPLLTYAGSHPLPCWREIIRYRHQNSRFLTIATVIRGYRVIVPYNSDHPHMPRPSHAAHVPRAKDAHACVDLTMLSLVSKAQTAHAVGDQRDPPCRVRGSMAG